MAEQCREQWNYVIAMIATGVLALRAGQFAVAWKYVLTQTYLSAAYLTLALSNNRIYKMSLRDISVFMMMLQKP